jgi:hypothetical protein
MTTMTPLLTPGGCQQVSLASIETGPACQTRVRIRSGVVRDYARAMSEQIRAGSLRFPAVVLFQDAEHYWVGDGFHRLLAAREAGLTEFPADVRPGTLRDALLFAISCNAEHGLPRNKGDKGKAVALLLADPEWSQWNDREIARRCQASQAYVTKLRRKLTDNSYQMGPRKVKRGDTVYEMRAKTKRRATAPPDAVVPAPESTPAALTTDRVGIALLPETGPAFASLSVLEAAEKLHAELAELVDRFAKTPGGAAFRQHLVQKIRDDKPLFYAPEMQVFGTKLTSAAPHCGYCPRCQPRHAGRPHPTCKLCGGRGWLTKGEFALCTSQERAELERLRKPAPSEP